MSKFMDMIEKTDKLKLDEQSLETLREMRLAFAEGVAFYAKKELLNDWWQDHYTNSRKHWENKLDALNGAIVRQEHRLLEETNVSSSSKSGIIAVQGVLDLH